VVPDEHPTTEIKPKRSQWGRNMVVLCASPEKQLRLSQMYDSWEQDWTRMYTFTRSRQQKSAQRPEASGKSGKSGLGFGGLLAEAGAVESLLDKMAVPLKRLFWVRVGW
jgi:hypothetical protein